MTCDGYATITLAREEFDTAIARSDRTRFLDRHLTAYHEALTVHAYRRAAAFLFDLTPEAQDFDLSTEAEDLLASLDLEAA